MQSTTSPATGIGLGSQPRPRVSPHERLTSLGLTPLGRASEFADDIYSLMAKTPLFSGLDMGETRTLGAFMYVYDAPAGLTLINEGDAGDFMVLLMSGTLSVALGEPWLCVGGPDDPRCSVHVRQPVRRTRTSRAARSSPSTRLSG